MFKTVERPDAPAAIRMDIGAILVSLELSRSTWLLTSVSPGAGEKMSQHETPAGDLRRLFECLAELKRKALARTAATYPIIVIQEAGLDGFWIHRALEKEGIESHVVDAASIAAPRRRRRAKTDRTDDRPGPIHMLNLVRLRARAAYPDGREATGAQAYASYGRESEPVFSRLGGSIVWRGRFELMLIGPQDERWDLCFIAEYPSVAAFVAMIRDPVYREAVKHRQAAVEDSRLIRLAPGAACVGFG